MNWSTQDEREYQALHKRREAFESARRNALLNMWQQAVSLKKFTLGKERLRQKQLSQKSMWLMMRSLNLR